MLKTPHKTTTTTTKPLRESVKGFGALASLTCSESIKSDGTFDSDYHVRSGVNRLTTRAHPS